MKNLICCMKMYKIQQYQELSKHYWTEVNVNYKYLSYLSCRKASNIFYKRLDSFNALYLATCWPFNTDAQGRM